MTSSTALHLSAAYAKWVVMWSHLSRRDNGGLRETRLTKVVPKIKSALQMPSVVILVIIIIRSRTVFPEQKKGPGTWKSREFMTSQGGSDEARLSSCSEKMLLISSRTEPAKGHGVHQISSLATWCPVRGDPNHTSCISPDTHRLPAEYTTPTDAAHKI